MAEGPILETKSLHARLMAASVVLLSGSGLATAINFAYNIALARFLGPDSFGHATVVYTLLTLISAVTLSFQIVSAKLVAQQPTPESKAAIYRDLHRSAWMAGIVVGLVLVVFQSAIGTYLKLPSSDMVALLGIGAAFYVPLGTRRGYIQGAYGFRSLATNLVLEGIVRLGGSLLLIMAGLGVRGVIAANAAAVAAAYFAARPRLAAREPNSVRFSRIAREINQAGVFFAGQVLINNCDIVLVKHFFAPDTAGLYAAVAMVGRVIFSCSQAVVNSMFPLVAGTREEERKDLRVIATGLLMVFGIGSAIALCLWFAPARVWPMFFGKGFTLGGKFGLPYLLTLYAITSVVYCLSVVIITYEMSYKIANTSWVQLAFSAVLIAGICMYHGSLREVILVQLILMACLLTIVAIPFLIDTRKHAKTRAALIPPTPLRIVQRISEEEVIAQFLKSDFSNPAFRDYQESLRHLVESPNLQDEGENAKRRALFYMRHQSLWKELPDGTEWFEVEVDEVDLARIRVFPRAQWRNLARGNFSIHEVVRRMRQRRAAASDQFLSKIASLRKRLEREQPDLAAVLLIGLDQNQPLTILDGNHRMAAAILDKPYMLDKLRFVCGLSPRMTECCWYKSNLVTLFRYGRNVIAQVTQDPEAELQRLIQTTTTVS